MIVTRPDAADQQPRRLNRMKMRTRTAAWALAGVFLSGCGGGSRAPVDAIVDRQAAAGTRVDAIRGGRDAVERGELTPEALREQLKRVCWSRGSPEKVRLAAFEELFKDEANLSDTESMIRLMLPTETNFKVIEFVGRESAARGWTSVTPALVRSWSRPAPDPPDAERPERKALMKMHPDRPVEDVVFDVFAGRSGGAALRDRDRIDAWGLLQRIDAGGARTRELLSGAAPPGGDGEADALIADLRAGAASFGCVPRTGEQLQWLRDLRRDEHAAFWRECEGVFASLGPEQREGFELRHLAAVRWAANRRSDWLAAGREALLARLREALENSKKHYRSGSGSTANELLRTWEPKLAWGDALLMLIALEIRDDPAVAGALFAQAEADRKDTSTEHGGVFDTDPSGRFISYPFAPRATQRLGDHQFSASEDMLKAGAAALFHYHLHVQTPNNGEYAGPSGQDLAYARQFGRSCLVFTSVRENILNVDYYQPGGATVDLGEVTRK